MRNKLVFFVSVPVLLILLAVGLIYAQGPEPGQETLSSNDSGRQVALGARTPLGSAFTYQGQLKDSGGDPIDDTCDLTFSLWDGEVGGSQVGSDSVVSGTVVLEGYFAAVVNGGGEFGAEAFTGDERWLEIAVQCTGDTTPVTLSPRQLLSAAPYALSLQPGAVISGTVAGAGGLEVVNSHTGGQGVFGHATAASGTTYGVLGQSDSTGGSGVRGVAGADSGTTYGVWAHSVSPNGIGVLGWASATSGTTYGVFGSSSSTAGCGVYGRAGATSGETHGVYGLSDSTSDYASGVYGYASASSGGVCGVYGQSDSTLGRGVYGRATASSGYAFGVWGRTESTEGRGVYGWASANSGETYGVYGLSYSTEGRGVYGYASRDSGVTTGVYGQTDSTEGRGVYGIASATTGTNYGVVGASGSTSGYAGYFYGDVHVYGTLSKSAGSFKIDHPLDPTGKYLYHSFVESPDMLNVYNGNATLDENGTAWVELPDWFEALNGGAEHQADFRYQLTCVGGYAPVYVAREIEGNRFQIAGGTPGLKVSWLVTGIRHDPYAEAHRIPVEEDKPADERGTYFYPELYGQPQSLGLDYQRQVFWAGDTP